MGSGSSYSSYHESASRLEGLRSSDEGVRKKAAADRTERIHHAKETVNEKKPENTREEVIDRSKIRAKITSPRKDVPRVHVFLIDNSGSNRQIAEALRKSSGYMAAVHGQIDPQSDFASIFFSDHGDGPLLMQEVDYVAPTPEGDQILLATIAQVHPANGYDYPEAIECALMRACELNFGDAVHKHLYLVSDQVAHGMGEDGDEGCPLQVNWRDALEKVMKTYDTFEVVGCGSSTRVGELQKQFLSPERLAFDFIDLSAIKEHQYRLGITANALLFLVARKQGMQAVEMFLSFLYEKWLTEPIFGDKTQIKAEEAIRRFGKFLECQSVEVDEMMKRIIV